MPDHTPLTAAELAEMRERCRVFNQWKSSYIAAYDAAERLTHCLDEIDDLRERLAERERQLLRLAWHEDVLHGKRVCSYFEGGACDCGLVELRDELRSTLSPVEPEGETR